MPFLPEGYKPPSTEGKYLKFKKPETRFRFLDSPILGWVGWKDKKPLRRQSALDFTEADVDKGDLTKVRHFWAAPVWGYELKRVQVLEITQASIQAKILTLSKDEDWGTPLDYDLLVTSTLPGQFETEYDVIAKPKRERGAMIESAWADALTAGFDITRLWTGGDPFADGHGGANEPVAFDERTPPDPNDPPF